MVSVNESCFFNEQCEDAVTETECRDGRCICRFDKTPITKKDGSVECIGENLLCLLFREANLLTWTVRSHQGKGRVPSQSSQPSDVFNSGCNGANVYNHLCSFAFVQQVSTIKFTYYQDLIASIYWKILRAFIEQRFLRTFLKSVAVLLIPLDELSVKSSSAAAKKCIQVLWFNITHVHNYKCLTTCKY